ncbi:hypothetical protein G7Y89_g8991 [Cudoniella acicularis]|uniref:Uncharacterized protein n=1 Tax=Cudoniella acicularis TaxID=354080 RepID=A0A8H4RI57_9HELO|nr:hypothetical protein G7Y89_g8991 [Cudoniella acicularis]
MSDLQVDVTLDRIVSIYKSSATLFWLWREERSERQSNEENQNLERSLDNGAKLVVEEYDNHFTRLGQLFAFGDDRGRSELAEYAIKLQHTIFIILKTETETSTCVSLPSHLNVLNVSDETKRGVTFALRKQYQRMTQSQPVGSNALSSAKQRWSTLPTTQFAFVAMKQKSQNSELAARYCAGQQFFLKVKTKEKVSAAISLESIWNWHFTIKDAVRNTNGMYGCKCCDYRYRNALDRCDVACYTLEAEFGLGNHISSQHYFTDLQLILGKGVGVCPCNVRLGIGHFAEHQRDCPATKQVREFTEKGSKVRESAGIFELSS